VEGYNRFEIIAHIQTALPDKFGVPRQSGLTPGLTGRIVFEKRFRNPDAIRGLEDFSHIWLLWLFSENPAGGEKLTVRPPRLGGNTRVGVFATRSPFRPSPVGLSSVRLVGIEKGSPDSPALIVEGADLVDGTPIIDIKPYLAFTDSHPDAICGFANENLHRALKVIIPENETSKLFPRELEAITSLLSQDPRPSYQNDPGRVYGMRYSDHEIKFMVDGDTLTVTGIEEKS